jgi:hypothetical protein
MLASLQRRVRKRHQQRDQGNIAETGVDSCGQKRLGQRHTAAVLAKTASSSSPACMVTHLIISTAALVVIILPASSPPHADAVKPFAK